MLSKWLDRVLIGIVALVIILIFTAGIRTAHSAGTSATVSFTHPTTYVDGSPLAVADIASVLITWRRTAGGPVVGTVSVIAPATSTIVPGLVCGNYLFTGQTVMKVNASTSDETTPPTPYSTGITCKANPPAGLQAS